MGRAWFPKDAVSPDGAFVATTAFQSELGRTRMQIDQPVTTRYMLATLLRRTNVACVSESEYLHATETGKIRIPDVESVQRVSGSSDVAKAAGSQYLG